MVVRLLEGVVVTVDGGFGVRKASDARSGGADVRAETPNDGCALYITVFIRITQSSK